MLQHSLGREAFFSLQHFIAPAWNFMPCLKARGTRDSNKGNKFKKRAIKKESCQQPRNKCFMKSTIKNLTRSTADRTFYHEKTKVRHFANFYLQWNNFQKKIYWGNIKIPNMKNVNAKTTRYSILLNFRTETFWTKLKLPEANQFLRFELGTLHWLPDCCPSLEISSANFKKKINK